MKRRPKYAYSTWAVISSRVPTLRGRLRGERLHLARNQTLGQIAAVLAGLLTMAGALVWMAWQALQGYYNLGDLAMFFQAMTQGQRLMRSLLTGVGEIYRNLLFLEDLFTFLELQPIISDPVEPVAMPAGLQTGIGLAKLTFRYPDSERVALCDFSLSIPAGKVLAIVGENGAGKSTLLKLLCRFYDPQEGAITWDGVDLRELGQRHCAGESACSSNSRCPITRLSRPTSPSAMSNAATQAEIEAAARGAGAASVIGRLPEGYETVLGKWFGYTQLSTGEWQRLALARAFVRQADLVILDEPTSAMDSWAENDWMNRFRELVDGRTAVIITHRFTTAMQADMIHVMHEGRSWNRATTLNWWPRRALCRVVEPADARGLCTKLDMTTPLSILVLVLVILGLPRLSGRPWALGMRCSRCRSWRLW